MKAKFKELGVMGGGGEWGGELSERVTLKDGLCEMMALVECGLLTYQLFSHSS